MCDPVGVTAILLRDRVATTVWQSWRATMKSITASETHEAQDLGPSIRAF